MDSCRAHMTCDHCVCRKAAACCGAVLSQAVSSGAANGRGAIKKPAALATACSALRAGHLAHLWRKQAMLTLLATSLPRWLQIWRT